MRPKMCGEFESSIFDIGVHSHSSHPRDLCVRAIGGAPANIRVWKCLHFTNPGTYVLYVLYFVYKYLCISPTHQL